MPLGFGASRSAGRLEVEVAADTDDFDKAMKELPGKARKAGDETGAEFEQQTGKRMKLLKVWLGANAVAIVGTLAFAFRDKLTPAIARTFGGLSKLGILMNSKVRRALGLLTRGVAKVGTSMLDWASLGIKGAGIALKGLGNRLKKEGVILNGFGHAVTALGHTMEKFGDIVGWVAGVWVKFKIGTLLGIGLFVAMSAKAAGEFENRFARVRTLLKGVGENDMRILGTSARRMSNEIGIASKEINDTLYQTLSAMPQLAQDTAAAMRIVGVAAKVAATGFAESETAVRAITGIMNAWKLEASEATAIADAMFAAQDQGVTTFGEMAASIGEVSGLTAALGGDWRDLLAIIATNTPFISTSETITGVASALSGVLEQGAPARKEAERLGLDFSAAALKAKGLIPFLREVAELTEGDPEIIAKLFGRREAVQLVVNLANNLDVLNEKLEIVRTTTGGLEDNLKIMNDTVERQGEILKTRFSSLLASMGLDFDRWKVKGYEAANAVLGYMTDVVEGNREAYDQVNKDAEEGNLPFTPRKGEGVFRTLERKLLANPAREITGFQIALADAIEVGVEQADATVFAQMIIDEKGNVAAAIARVMNEGLEIWKIQSKNKEPLKDFLGGMPAAPVGLAPAQKKIHEFHQSLKATALFNYLESSDIEAYNDELVTAQDRVNSMVLAERNRILAAQEAGTVTAANAAIQLENANDILDLFVIQDDQAAQAAANRAKEASLALDMMIRTREIGERFGAVGMEEAPAALRPVIAGIHTVDAEIQRHAALLKDIVPLSDAWYRSMDRLGVLQQQRVELFAMGAEYEHLLPLIESFGVEMADWVRSLPVEKQQEMTDSLAESAVALDAVDNAQREYNLAIERYGPDSEAAAIKAEKLKKQIEASRAILLASISVMNALGWATEGTADAIDRLNAMLAAMGGGGGGGEKKGGLLGFLFENADMVEGLARGLLSVADAIGQIGEDARQSLQGVIDLSSGIKGIKDSMAAGQGIPIGGLAQAIGGGIGLISGIVGMLGESEADKRRREMLEKNTNALRSLKESIDKQRQIATGWSAKDFQRAQDLGTVFDAYGDPQSMKERVLAQQRVGEAMKALGVEDIQELQRWLDELGINIQILNDEGKLVPENMKLASEALKEITLEDIFGGIEGALSRLRLEMDLFDIDEPLDQLKKYYAFLKSNTELGVPDFDLDTAEGRAALDAWLRTLFEGFTDLDPSMLGDMTPEQILDLIGTIKGLTDTIDEGPDSTSFQEFRGVTEVTANRLAGLLTTDVYWNEMTALNVRELVKLGGGVPIGPGGSDDIVPNYGDDFKPRRPEKPEIIATEVNINTLEVNVIEAEDMDAGEIANAVVDRVSRDLGKGLVRQQRSGGGMLTRTVR